jgi:2-phospho-L-lactate/phosphoenolpyruvate guanylyltransferase
MTTVAVLPIKRFEGAKRRLSGALSPGTRRALAMAMAADVLTALRRAQRIDLAVVVTADREAEALAHGHDARSLPDPEQPGHSAAALAGIGWALEHGADRVLLVPGDCPAVFPQELDALVAAAGRAPEVLLVPDRHGTGTNALLLSPGGVLAPAFGEGSRARHEAAAAAAGASLVLHEPAGLLLDVDTPEDLEALRAALAATRGGAAHTRGMLARLGRTTP